MFVGGIPPLALAALGLKRKSSFYGAAACSSASLLCGLPTDESRPLFFLARLSGHKVTQGQVRLD